MLRLILTEYKKIFTDFGALLILFVAVFLYALFYPLPYLNEVVKKTPIIVVDDDRSSLSRMLIRSFKQNDLLLVKEASNQLEAGKIYSREVRAIVRIGKDFARKIYSNKQTSVDLYIDASYFLIYKQVFTGLAQSIKTLGAQIEIKKLLAKNQALNTAMVLRDPMPLKVNYLFNPVQGYLSYIVPSVLILIIQQTLIIGIGLVMASNKHEGKYESKQNISPLKILTAKILAYYFLYMGYLMVYFYVVYRMFDLVLRGHFWDIFIFSSLFLIAAISLGILLSSLFKHRESSMQFLLFSSILALFLAGFVWPQEAISPLLYYPSLSIPSTSAILGFMRINQMGASLQECASEAINLLVLAIVYTGAAFYMCKRRLKANLG